MGLDVITRVVGRSPGGLRDTKAALLYADEVAVQWAPQVASEDDNQVIGSFGDTEVERRKAFEKLEEHMAQTEAELGLARHAGAVGGLLKPRTGLLGAVAEAIVERLGDLDDEAKLLALLGSDPVVVPPDSLP